LLLSRFPRGRLGVDATRPAARQLQDSARLPCARRRRGCASAGSRRSPCGAGRRWACR
jgi:hypothetical protein